MTKTQYLTSCSAGGLHKLAYNVWGDINNPNVLICSHGLTRNKRDFDVLASKLSAKRRVVCFDLPGRGESDWLKNKNAYDYSQYMIDALMIIANSHVEKVDWLGTSMGGLLGMALAAQPNSPIKSLIVNDVGPYLPKEALQRIADYVSQPPTFDTKEELESYMKSVYSGFGDLTDQQWHHMFNYGHRLLDNGQLTLNYDPDISKVFTDKPLEDIDLWPVWQAIQQPTLILRGENSDVLLANTAEQMIASSPMATLMTIPNTGHSPALMNEHDIRLIEQWLEERSAIET